LVVEISVINLKRENAELKKESEILKERFALLEEWLKDTSPKWKEKWQQWFLEPKKRKKLIEKKRGTRAWNAAPPLFTSKNRFNPHNRRLVSNKSRFKINV
jgi:hypothetical protein